MGPIRADFNRPGNSLPKFFLEVFLSFAITVLLVSLAGCGGAKMAVVPASAAQPAAMPSTISITISAPGNDAVLASPVHVIATVADSNPGASLELMADGAMVAQSDRGKLEADVPLAIGPHSLVARASDSAGQSAQQSVTVSIPAPRFAYAANTDGTISVFAVDAKTGQLRPHGYAVMPGLGDVISVTATPSGKFVYASNSGGIVGYKADPETGRLTSLPGFPLWGRLGVDRGGNGALTIDPTGNFLYSSLADFPFISGFQIDQNTGALTEMSDSPFPGAPGVSFSAPELIIPMSFSPNGAFAYFAGNQGSVATFRVDPTTGSLSPPLLTPGAGGIPYTQLDGSGRYLFASDTSSGSGKVWVYAVDPNNGTLKNLAGSPFTVSNYFQAARERLAASSRFLWAEDGDLQSISTFKIDPASQTLQRVGQWRAPAGGGTLGELKVDPSGQFLYVSDVNTLYTLIVDSHSGALSAASSVRNASHDGANAIAISAGKSALSYTPNFVFVGLSNPRGQPAAGALEAFAFDPQNGTLTSQMPPRNFSGAPQQTLMADGNLLLDLIVDTTAESGNLATFTVDPQSGQLSDAGSEIVGSAGFSMSLHPNGDAAYVAQCMDPLCTMPGQILGFSVNPGGGQIQPLATPSFLMDAWPEGAISMDPLGKFLFAAETNGPGPGGTLALLQIDPAAKSPNALNPIALASLSRVGTLSPSGKWLYIVPDDFNPSIIAYGIDPSGSLGILSSSPVQMGAYWPAIMTIDPTGHFAFILGQGTDFVGDPINGAVFVFRINQQSGGLSPVAGSPYSLTVFPNAMTMDDSGQFLFVANGPNLTVYKLDTTQGTLSEISGSPFYVGGSQQLNATAVAVSSTIQ